MQKKGSKPLSPLKILVHAFIFLVLGSKTKCQLQSQEMLWGFFLVLFFYSQFPQYRKSNEGFA